jgi:Zn-dependent metalloprotease
MPGVEVRYGENGAVTKIKGHTGIFLSSGLDGFAVNAPAQELLQKVGPALLAAGTEELRVVDVNREAARNQPDSPERTVRLSQYIRGLEVQLSAVNIRVNQETNEITQLVADFLPDRGLQHEAKLTAAQARAKVEAAMTAGGLGKERRIVFEDKPARLAYAFEEVGENGGVGGLLVWVFLATQGDPGEELEASVNAATGEIVRLQPVTSGLTRISYTAQQGTPPPSSFPNGLVFTFGEGGTPPDALAAAAYNNMGITFATFQTALGRNSWDRFGAPRSRP